MGVIVYMLLSGKPPFDGKEDADVLRLSFHTFGCLVVGALCHIRNKAFSYVAKGEKKHEASVAWRVKGARKHT